MESSKQCFVFVCTPICIYIQRYVCTRAVSSQINKWRVTAKATCSSLTRCHLHKVYLFDTSDIVDAQIKTIPVNCNWNAELQALPCMWHAPHIESILIKYIYTYIRRCVCLQAETWNACKYPLFQFTKFSIKKKFKIVMLTVWVPLMLAIVYLR